MPNQTISFKLSKEDSWSDRFVADPLHAALIICALQRSEKYGGGCLRENLASSTRLPENVVEQCLFHLESQGFVFSKMGQVGTGGTLGLFWKAVPGVTLSEIKIERPVVKQSVSASAE